MAFLDDVSHGRGAEETEPQEIDLGGRDQTSDRSRLGTSPASASATGNDKVEMAAPAAISRSVPYEELPEFLTPDELCGYLALSRNTVYELLRRQEIPHVRFGRLIRVPKTALLIDRQRDVR
jgi:excisionase family DNA binding protein